MYQIRSWLYKGSYVEKIDADKLNAHSIGAMLQLYRPFALSGIVTEYLKVEDGYAIQPATIDRAIAFIRAHQPQKVLIACGAGISRSTTFSIVALKTLEGLSMEQALREIRAVQPEAMPDQVHWESLRTYYGEGAPFWEVWE